MNSETELEEYPHPQERVGVMEAKRSHRSHEILQAEGKVGEAGRKGHDKKTLQVLGGLGQVTRALKIVTGGTSASKGTEVCWALNGHFLGLREALTPTKGETYSTAVGGWGAELSVGC